uniref:lysozyme n=1 Tax=Glossina brevipalpis TaxID=37001 RepID=A0A1A9WK38_9MUSC
MIKTICNVVALISIISYAISISTTIASEKPVTDNCLHCLCMAISECNQTAVCRKGACGPFRMTYYYWAHGGNLTLDSDTPGSVEAFPNCANDLTCATNTVQNYMARYSQDCNNDGVVDCYDYAAIHNLGPFGCKNDLPYQYAKDMDLCLKPERNEKPVSDVCLDCLCKATSGCNKTASCKHGACGPFHITYPYWVKGGKLTLDGDSSQSVDAFPNCVSDYVCAANTIQNYMQRYGQDCNNDREINCHDYAAIHKLGGYGCKGDLPEEYLEVLDMCLNKKN